ncbi:hypothetical protein ACH5RR_009075 [Cinchona calisaya]|uniref:Tify domain-containing protein n=1 Tax=Cinchona calisaya TaxID=153742 RepID=A0ABD3ADX2_9GENT
MSKDYLDAVYVDHQGRTYRSVTLAYKKLKQMVEDGTTDAKAISAFSPIPEDKLSLLYRITKEKGKKCKKKPKVGGNQENDGFKVYNGKRTLLAWMIDLGTVSPGGKVVSYFDFEAHAGSTLGRPDKNIYLESGHSLLQCMIESWTKQELNHDIQVHLVNVHDDPSDDICSICGNGGDLICCDGCPSTFHPSWLQIQSRGLTIL